MGTIYRMICSLEAEVNPLMAVTPTLDATSVWFPVGSPGEELAEGVDEEFGEEVERVRELAAGLAKRLQGCEKTIDASLGRNDRTLEDLRFTEGPDPPS
jgi:hypothetical protein